MVIEVSEVALLHRLNCLAEPAQVRRVDSHGPSAFVFRIELP
jgi:hypothetical protein